MEQLGGLAGASHMLDGQFDDCGRMVADTDKGDSKY
jgi:hypothetical protein